MSKSADPVCFVSPKLGSQLLVARYITVGTMSVFIWEILNNIFRDYKLLSEHRIRFPTVVYFTSRLFTLGFTICSTIFYTTPLSSTCNALEKTMDVFYALAIIFSSLLFFFRAQAVFDKNIWAVAFFSCSWLAVVAGCVAYLVKLGGVKIGPGFCEVVGAVNPVNPYAAAAIIIPLVNDTLVFLAITWCLFRDSRRTLRDRVRVLTFYDYLLVLSKAMLQDGQAYYLITITVNLVTVIMFFDQSIPDSLRTVFTVPNVAVMNIMTCRVFRKMIFGTFRESQISASLDLNADSSVIQLAEWEQGSGSGRTKQPGDATFNIDGIAVTQTVERRHDYAQ